MIDIRRIARVDKGLAAARSLISVAAGIARQYRHHGHRAATSSRVFHQRPARRVVVGIGSLRIIYTVLDRADDLLVIGCREPVSRDRCRELVELVAPMTAKQRQKNAKS